MAAKTTYGVKECATQRTSPRTYTHAIVGRRDPVADRIEHEAFVRRHLKGSWAYYVSLVGEPKPEWRDDSTSYAEEQARFIAIRDTGEAAYIESTVADSLQRFDEGSRNIGNLVVIQWSMSARAAHNAVGSWIKRGWLDVRVVDAFPVKKTKGTPNSLGSICR